MWNFFPLHILSPCAYLASLLGNKKEVLALRPAATERLEKEIAETTALIQQLVPSAKLPKLSASTKQRDLVKCCSDALREELLAECAAAGDHRACALLRTQSQRRALLWLSAPHLPEFFLPGHLLRLLALRSVGATVFQPNLLCPNCHEVVLDRYGDHALICMDGGDVVHRHGDMCGVLIAGLRRGLVGLDVEKTLDKTEQGTYRPDFSITHGIPGFTNRATHCDVTISDPFAKTVVKLASKKDLVTARRAEARKNKEQKDDLEALEYDFLPLAFETTGGHCENMEVLATYIAQQQALMTNTPFEETHAHLWYSLSIALQRANANALHRRHVQTLPIEGDD